MVADIIIRRLDKRRREVGLSMAQLAKLTGYNEDSVEDFLNLKLKRPSLTMAIDLAMALDMQLILEAA